MEILGAAALYLATAAAAASAFALCGAFSASLDALTHAAPLTGAAAAAALVLALASGEWPAAVIAMAALCCVALLVAPELRKASGAPEPGGDGRGLKVIQFNLWWTNRDPAGTLAWLRSEAADILVLQETMGPSSRILEALADLYPHRAPPKGGPRSSTLIFSKAPMRDAGVLPSSGPGRPHNQAWARFADGEAAFAVVGVHLSWPIPPGRQQRQIGRLEAGLAQFDRTTLVLAGDFNSTPWSFALRRLDRRLGLSRRTLALATWPARGGPYLPLAPFPFLPIDHVYAGAGWSTISVKRGPRLGSDHYPVAVVLARASPTAPVGITTS